METRKDRHIGWEKVDRCHERDTFEKVAGLDAICFNDKAYERLTADTHIYGDIFALPKPCSWNCPPTPPALCGDCRLRCRFLL